MESEQNKIESDRKIYREIPLHFRLMDVFLEQIGKAAPLYITTLKDIQTIYLDGTRLMLKAGESVENRSDINVKFFRTLSNTFDSISPVITEAQLGVTKAIIDSTCQSIKLMRKSITGRK